MADGILAKLERLHKAFFQIPLVLADFVSHCLSAVDANWRIFFQFTTQIIDTAPCR